MNPTQRKLTLQEICYFFNGPETTESHKRRESYGHLRFVVRVFVQVWPLLVQFFRMNLKQNIHRHTVNYVLLSCLFRSLADRWGTTVHFTTSFLHSSWFSAFHGMIFHSRPVMLSSHRFLCLPLRLPPSTVPCKIVLASPDDRVTCPYHFSLRLFTEVRRSSYSPMAFPILAFTSSFVMRSLYEIPRNLQKHLISSACILLSMSAVMVHISHAYKNMDMARERVSLILE